MLSTSFVRVVYRAGSIVDQYVYRVCGVWLYRHLHVLRVVVYTLLFCVCRSLRARHVQAVWAGSGTEPPLVFVTDLRMSTDDVTHQDVVECLFMQTFVSWLEVHRA